MGHQIGGSEAGKGLGQWIHVSENWKDELCAESERSGFGYLYGTL